MNNSFYLTYRNKFCLGCLNKTRIQRNQIPIIIYVVNKTIMTVK